MEKVFSSIKVDKDVFKNIKQLARIKRNCEVPNLVVNGVLYNDLKDKVNIPADHFANIHRQNKCMGVPEFTENVDMFNQRYQNPAPLFQFNDIMNSQRSLTTTPNPIYDQLMTIDELDCILRSRNNQKSEGNHIVLMYLLKKVISFKNLLVIIFNNMYNNSFLHVGKKRM